MQQALLTKCDGEAHSNPYIDNCWACAPLWSDIYRCVDDNSKLKLSKNKRGELTGKGFCLTCKKYYLTTGPKMKSRDDIITEAVNAWAEVLDKYFPGKENGGITTPMCGQIDDLTCKLIENLEIKA